MSGTNVEIITCGISYFSAVFDQAAKANNLPTTQQCGAVELPRKGAKTTLRFPEDSQAEIFMNSLIKLNQWHYSNFGVLQPLRFTKKCTPGDGT